MKYKITALTPLLVGDGRELSPIDYMVWNNQVNVLDQGRIFRLLARGPRLEGYLTQLRKATKLDFAAWGGFAQNFSQRRIPFEHADSAASWNSAPPESLFIPTFAADHRGAYLPGSALKGALRTGLVFSRWSAGTLDRAAATMEGDRLPRRIGEAAETGSGASQVKIVAVADSAPAAGSAFKIFLTRVASLDTRQPAKPQLVWKVAGRGSVPAQRMSEATPVFAEMALPGTTFTGKWEERKFLEDPDVARAHGWRSTPEPKLLTDAANKLAEAQLEVHSRYAEAAGLPQLRATIGRLQQALAGTQSSELSCILSLGWGGGFVSKAGFIDTDQQGYRKILRAVPSFGRSVREGIVFPKTRRIVFVNGQPSALPGWVELRLEK